jgi:putative endonuclease
MKKQYYVYILTNQGNNVLYTGFTNDLKRRVFEHKEKLIDGFTGKYNIDKLVYFESTENVNSAIERER